ncbi:hypothetical protein D187_000593 [Cystobacter fuscus DSM 2262]|uniref:Uncharacterized protein n=1 Tax=Cystobacter fuscus (strain ATCC 25194 / DSM 2262 / NBRC 100088 / M29) TaxID=1242864 RepID=S9R7Y8_CYSF2|nr:hypothetical protein D187_000593 [Cystobacter fuscus DSM 2262]
MAEKCCATGFAEGDIGAAATWPEDATETTANTAGSSDFFMVFPFQTAEPWEQASRTSLQVFRAASMEIPRIEADISR